MIDKPRLIDDGAHLIPIWKFRCADCECHPEATGTLTWYPDKGATYSLEFPNCSSIQLRRYYRNPPESAEVGRIAEHPMTPRWIAETFDGLRVELYTLDDRVHERISENGFQCKVTGNAWFAAVKLGNESPLSFWNSTPEKPRAFFLGFGSYHWAKQEDSSFQNGSGTTSTTRRSVLLSDSAGVEVYEADFRRVNLPDGGWMTCDNEEKTGALTSFPCASYSSFISFLNGRMTPMLWHDSFVDSSSLQRVYFGVNHARLDHLNHILPLLPFKSSSGTQSAESVVEQLPALFAAYLQVNKTVDLVFVLAPLWSACESLLTDRFALACVSLERLATAWKKSPRGRAADSKRRFWTRLQSGRIRKALRSAVDALATETQLNVVQIAAIKNRIDNLGQRTNEDKLTAIFDDLHLELSDSENKVIAQRNHSLHGKATLCDRSSLPEIDAEVLRFDTLRMVITKAVLALLQYRGPYIDYAARLPQRDFPVEYLKLNLTNPRSEQEREGNEENERGQ